MSLVLLCACGVPLELGVIAMVLSAQLSVKVTGRRSAIRLLSVHLLLFWGLKAATGCGWGQESGGA